MENKIRRTSILKKTLPFSLSSPSGNQIRDLLAKNFPELCEYIKPQSYSVIHETFVNGSNGRVCLQCGRLGFNP